MRLADDISRARFVAREAQSENVTAPQLFDRIAEVAQNRMTAVEDIVEAGARSTRDCRRHSRRSPIARLAIIALSLASGVAAARRRRA